MDINFNMVPSTEWNWHFGEGDKRFFITVRAHHRNYSPEVLQIMRDEGQWCWCMYAIFPEKHPFFSNKETPLNFDWHGGATYDQIHSQKYTVEKYEWQRPHSYRKVGCDYQHYMDEQFAHMSPADGVPSEIRGDAMLLVRQINEAISSVLAIENGGVGK